MENRGHVSNSEQLSELEKCPQIIVGIDEAGRGPLAGPVVSAALILPEAPFKNKITDSKKLSSAQRDRAFEELYQNAKIGVGIVSETRIDQINILEATFEAMNLAVEDLIAKFGDALDERRIFLMIDGNRFRNRTPYGYETIVKGDEKNLSIAAASIIAKVTRDRIMENYHQQYPQYNFRSHKGYPTKAHKDAIRKYGYCPIHRRTFRV